MQSENIFFFTYLFESETGLRITCLA